MTNSGEFEFRLATPEEIADHQAFRFGIFGEECGYLDYVDCPLGRDDDGFDPFSSHAFALKLGEYAGCCRLTYSNDVGGSYTEKFFHLPPPPVDRSRIAELNRFAIAAPHRRSSDSKTVMFGMFGVLYEEAIAKGIEYVYLTMHRPFFVLLRRMGIPFVFIEDYQIKEYSGYYWKYFDPSDTVPSILNTEAFGGYMHYKGYMRPEG